MTSFGNTVENPDIVVGAIFFYAVSADTCIKINAIITGVETRIENICCVTCRKVNAVGIMNIVSSNRKSVYCDIFGVADKDDVHRGVYQCESAEI